MSKTAKQADTAAAPVKVRITAHRTVAAGMMHAAGAVISLPLEKAQTLEKLGKATILGV